MVSWAFFLEFIFRIYYKGYQSRLIYMNIWYATINILNGKKIRFLKIQIMKDIFKEIMNVFGYPISSMFLMKESRCCGGLNNSSPKDIHVLNPGNYECHSMWQKRDFANIINYLEKEAYPGLFRWSPNAITNVLVRRRQSEVWLQRRRQ